MLQVKNISKSYTTSGFTQKALDNVSVAFRDNEFAAILGPSGSGKTTLLNIIGGLDQYDSGDLIIDGISTKDYKDRDWDTYRNNRVGFVFQSYNLIGHQTVIQNVELALTLSGVGKAERHKRAEEVLERVGLGSHINKRPNQLSGGQMQRVAIARALINDPEILLADEPTGALDSQTSVEVMDLLQEIANDRLVVMVTHNPELAEQYATRIINLRDGVIGDDTNPYNPTEEEIASVKAKEPRKASMNFATALSLSFNNLMSKKGRTFMTAFAGSIGIIGIALILALSNGVNKYINDVEEETLTSYPLSVTKSGMDLSSLVSVGMDMGGSSDDDSDSSNESNDVMDTEVGQQEIVNDLIGGMTNNDLESLKAWIDSSDGQRLRDNASSISYSYGISPYIYVKGQTDEDYRKANPDTSLTALGMGSTSYSNSTMSTMMTTNIFQEMPDQSLLEDTYELKAGKWPTEANEAILCLSSNGNVLDYTLYQLGFRDFDEFEDMVAAVVQEKEIGDYEDNNTYTYSDFFNVEMKTIVAADLYQKDEQYGVWVDKSDDQSYVDNLIAEKGEDFKIVGIVQAKDGENATTLTGGCIYYNPEMVTDGIEKAAQTDIVKEQQANHTVNVFSGKEFSEEDSSSDLNLEDMITVDEGAISAAFNFDTSSMSLDLTSISANFSAADIGNMVPQMDTSKVQQLLGSSTQANQQMLDSFAAAVLNGYFGWQKQVQAENPSAGESDLSVEKYLESDVYTGIRSQFLAGMDTASQQMIAGLSQYMQQYMQEAMTAVSNAMSQQMLSSMSSIQNQLTTNIANAISVDASKLADAFQLNIDQDELSSAIMAMLSGGEESSYENNLSTLGYCDLNTPTMISIYAKNFDAKQAIIDELDGYNDNMLNSGQDDKQVTYSDIIGVMMNGVRTIINVISYLLIAFVSISLVVSSIMIGIITYVSVLERTKEIGVLRSIGASKKNVKQVFNAETVIEGLIAGILGVVVTALLCIPANIIIYNLTGVSNLADLPFTAAVILVCISVFLTFIAGLLPASSAARKDPVEALRSE